MMQLQFQITRSGRSIWKKRLVLYNIQRKELKKIIMITYREYKENDWKTICQIHDRARPDELVGSCDPRGFIPIEEDEEVEDLKRNKKFVACEDDKVVGFAGVDEDYLAWLYVD